MDQDAGVGGIPSDQAVPPIGERFRQLWRSWQDAPVVSRDALVQQQRVFDLYRLILQYLREKREQPLSLEVQREYALLLDVVQRASRSDKVDAADILLRAEAIVGILSSDNAAMEIAQQQRTALQLDVASFAGGWPTRVLISIAGRSPLVMALSAVCCAVVIGALLMVVVNLLNLIPIVSKQLWMDSRSVFTITAAAFLGGSVSVMIRLSKLGISYPADPFVPFWTTMLKPLIGVAVSLFVLALLYSRLIEIAGFSPPDPDLIAATPSNQLLAAFDRFNYGLFAIGFVAGFSERLASDLIGGVEQRIPKIPG